MVMENSNDCPMYQIKEHSKFGLEEALVLDMGSSDSFKTPYVVVINWLISASCHQKRFIHL